jgi:hypothetical protein
VAQLVSQGGYVSASISPDGSNWTQLSGSWQAATSNVFCGLFATAGYDGSSNFASFDNVAVSQSAFGFSLKTSATNIQTPANATASVLITSLGTPGFADTVSLSISGVPSGVSATFGTVSLTGSATTALTFSVGASAAPGEYSLTITGTDAMSGVTQSAAISFYVLPYGGTWGESLPAGWSSQDIGQPAVAGHTVYENGTFVMQGSGSGILAPSTSDQMQYAFTSLEGDGSIVARLATMQNLGSEAGLMIRDSLDPSSAYVALYVNSSYVYLVARSASGSESTGVAGGSTQWLWFFTIPPVQFPVWLKLARQANNFSAYSSEDGVNWTPVLPSWQYLSVQLAPNAYAGILDAAVANPAALNTVAFDNVSVTSSSSGFRCLPSQRYYSLSPALRSARTSPS